MDFKPSPLQKLDLSLFGLKNEVYIKRDDLIHPIVSGNKWRKLKRNISYYKTIDSKGIISMGGAYSSHILALSYVCFKNNIPCVLMVRGEEPKQQSDILIQCLKYKAIINYCSRENYSSNIWMSNYCNDNYPSHFFIPEGAANEYGIKGCSEIIREISIDFDEIYCEVGTGATLAGISSALKPTQKVKGIVVLKGAKGIEKEIHDLLELYLQPFRKKNRNEKIRGIICKFGLKDVFAACKNLFFGSKKEHQENICETEKYLNSQFYRNVSGILAQYPFGVVDVEGVETRQ